MSRNWPITEVAMKHESVQFDFFEIKTIEEGASGLKDAPDLFYELRGRIEKVISFDEANGFCLLETRIEPHQKPLLISTRVPRVWPGMSFTARLADADESAQLLGPAAVKKLQAVVEMTLLEPSSSRTLKKFLKSQPLGHLGKVTIESLAKEFPNGFFSLLRTSPERLRQVPGIGKSRTRLLVARWHEFQVRAKIDEFLFKEGLPLSWAYTLWTSYGEAALEMFCKSPYVAAKAHGFSFERIDAFALKNGFGFSDPQRLALGLNEIIHCHFQQGHCACPDERVVKDASSRLKVSRERIDEALELAILQGDLVTDVIGDTNCIYRKEAWLLEQNVALRLLEFSEMSFHPVAAEPGKLTRWAQRFLDINLSPQQTMAVEEALSSSLTLITGGPGTGKTTLIRCLVAILESQSVRYALCAPTGRAAQRLSETTGAEASTVHRLLQLDVSSNSNGRASPLLPQRKKTLDVEMLLVDEASMMDLALMSRLLDAVPAACALVLIGDADQLPSVGAGTVLQSLISSKKFPVVELTDIFRQNSGSGIRLNAELIRNGKMPVETCAGGHDFRYLPVTADQDVMPAIKRVLLDILPNECGLADLRQVQILTPMNQGPFGSRQLNEELRDDFNPRAAPGHRNCASSKGVKSGSDAKVDSTTNISFQAGDKVMVNKNDYMKNVFNGDIGYVVALSQNSDTLEVAFSNRLVSFKSDELNSLTLAYAISIHKSQGSEYRAVIVVLTEGHLPLAQRHLIYTAVTRGKNHVFLIANPNVLKTAIVRSDKRWQNLTALLSAV